MDLACSEAFQGLPSSWVKMRALGASPSVQSRKRARAWSVRTISRALPDLLWRTPTVPACSLKSAARIRVSSPPQLSDTHTSIEDTLLAFAYLRRPSASPGVRLKAGGPSTHTEINTVAQRSAHLGTEARSSGLICYGGAATSCGHTPGSTGTAKACRPASTTSPRFAYRPAAFRSTTGSCPTALRRPLTRIGAPG